MEDCNSSSQHNTTMARIKTLAGITSIMITNETVGIEIKEKVCSGTSLTIDDILLVQNGREIKDNHKVTISVSKSHISHNNVNDKKKVDTFIFAIIRSTSTRKANLVIKNKNENKSYNLSFQMNMKIFQLRKEISKLAGIRTTALRMIIGSRVLKDECILGDYILSAAKKNNVQKQAVVIQISRIIDITQDADIKIHFPNKSILEFSMEVGVAISTARQILAQRFYMPLDVPLEIYLDKQYQNKLDYSRSLLDYGIYPMAGKKTIVDLYIKVYDGNNKMPLDSLDNMLDCLIHDISSSMKAEKKTSKAMKLQSALKTTTTLSANASTTQATTSSVPSKKPSSKGGLFSSMRRGFLSNKKDSIKKDNDDCIITKDDATPIKIQKMSNVTKQVNTLLFDKDEN